MDRCGEEEDVVDRDPLLLLQARLSDWLSSGGLRRCGSLKKATAICRDGSQSTTGLGCGLAVAVQWLRRGLGRGRVVDQSRRLVLMLLTIVFWC